jgi:anti-anti-sigma regulatory factor
MITQPLLRREAPDFKAEANHQESVIPASLVGTADMRAAEQLEQSVSELHEATLSQGAARLCMGLRLLEFMSSCSIKSLVSWLVKLEELPTERQCQVRFVCDP